MSGCLFCPTHSWQVVFRVFCSLLRVEQRKDYFLVCLCSISSDIMLSTMPSSQSTTPRASRRSAHVSSQQLEGSRRVRRRLHSATQKNCDHKTKVGQTWEHTCGAMAVWRAGIMKPDKISTTSWNRNMIWTWSSVKLRTALDPWCVRGCTQILGRLLTATTSFQVACRVCWCGIRRYSSVHALEYVQPSGRPPLARCHTLQCSFGCFGMK